MSPQQLCKSIGCTQRVDANVHADFCPTCLTNDGSAQQLSSRYPLHYRSVGDATELDVFAINQLFKVDDQSGCLQHAIRKLLMASTLPTTYADISEARDTLTRWLQLNQAKDFA